MQPNQPKDVRQEAVDMVEWYLNFALDSTATSWTMEQVNQKRVRDLLNELKRKYPLKVDWIVADAADYSVPQHRRRVIAGSPFLIANLRTFTCKRKRSIRDVFPNPPREYVRNSLYSRPDPETGEHVEVPLKDQIRSVDEPCFTILATGHCKWADKNGLVLRHLKGWEKALIQTFPPDYHLPWNKELVAIGVGNAVSPRLAEILMKPTCK